MHRKIIKVALLVALAAGLPLLAAPISRAAGPSSTLYLPLVSRLDPYKDWAALGLPAGNPQPAGPAAVNFLYLSPTCDDVQPTSILAGTDRGLYSYGNGWTLNAGLGSDIQVSHIFSPAPGELFVASYDRGLYHSTNGGGSWTRENVANKALLDYWVASGGSYLYVATSEGLYRRPIAGGTWNIILSGKIYSLAVTGSSVYAAQIGSAKDTLFVSSDGGDTWPITRQIPGGVNFVQTLDAPTGAQLLIGAVNGGLYTLDGTNTIVPFSQGISQTVYGIWRDAQARVYAALEAPGGLRRLPAAGGTSDLDLSPLPGGGSLASQTLYTVNGSAACNIVAVGSEGGGVWMRRLP
jgi:hypothetical protein